MINPTPIISIFPGFDGIKEAFALLGKRFSTGTNTMVDNFTANLGLGGNTANYSGETMWHIIKESFNITYINYSTFINIGLIIFFVIISILILMKWLGPVWNQITGGKKEIEEKKGLGGIFSLFSVFLSKISKYIISFIFVIMLTLLLTFVSKKIIDNGEYGIDSNKYISVSENEPLLFNHFKGSIKPIMFVGTAGKDDYKYMIENNTTFYGPFFIYTGGNNKKFVYEEENEKERKNILYGVNANKVETLRPYNIANGLALSGGFNYQLEYKLVDNSKIGCFDIAGIGHNNSINNIYCSQDYKDNKNKYEYKKSPANQLRANKKNTGGFNINIELGNSGNIGNKEIINLDINNKNQKILSEITGNKKKSLTVGKDVYLSVSLSLENINTIDVSNFKIRPTNKILNGKQISYIFKYNTGSNDDNIKLDQLYICKTNGDTITQKQLKSCLSFKNYNFERLPFIIQDNKIIVNDFGSIISTLFLLQALQESDKNNKNYINFIKSQIRYNNIADLGINSFPLQYSYRYKIGIQTVSTSSSNSNDPITLGDDKYQTNLLYKYTPSFILSLTYLEKITGKSALNVIPSNDSNTLKKYYNKYFAFAEGNSIKDIYIDKDSNTINNYLTLNRDQVIDLVGAEGTGNGNVYKIGMVETNNAITPITLGLYGGRQGDKDSLFMQALIFNNNQIEDGKLAPEQINILMKSMLTSSIYYYYIVIAPEKVNIWNTTTDKTTKKTINGSINTTYYEDYLNTNGIYKYLYNFNNLVYKGWFIGILKLLLYLLALIIGLIMAIAGIMKAIMSIGGNNKPKKKLGNTGKKIEELSGSVGSSKIVQMIFIFLGMSAFYILYEWAIIIFISASLIGIFLLGRENKGEQDNGENNEKSTEETAKVKQSVESNHFFDKVKGSAIVLKQKGKGLLENAVKTGIKTQSFLRGLGNTLIVIAANAYSFILISLVVYLVITSLMIYFNDNQVLTFNKLFGLYSDLFFLVFLITWMAAIFSFQGKLSDLVSGFIINQVTGQNSFLNNFLQSHLDQSTFNKVTMGQNNITDAVIKNMKVGLNKIEEQSENEKFKKTMKSIKEYKKNISDHFDKGLQEKDKRMTLVSDLIEKGHLGKAVKLAKSVKNVIGNNKLSQKIRKRTAQLMHNVTVGGTISGVNIKTLNDKEIESLLLNTVLDQEKRKRIYDLMKVRGLNDEDINKFLKDLEKGIKKNYSVKIKALTPSIDTLFNNAKRGVKGRNFYNLDEALLKLMDEEAKILGIDVNDSSFINYRNLTKKLYDKDLNAGMAMDLLQLFKGDKNALNESLPFIDKFLDSNITLEKLKEKLLPIFKEMGLSETEINKIMADIVLFKDKIDKNDLYILKKDGESFFELSGRKGPLSGLLYNDLFKGVQTTNIQKFKQEKDDIVSNIKKNIDKNFPNGTPQYIDDILNELEKTNDLAKFSKLVDTLYANKAIDGNLYKNINDTNIQKYLKTIDKIMVGVDKNDLKTVETELDNLSALLANIDPNENKRYIGQINNFKKLIKEFDISKLADMDHKVRNLTTNTLLSTKQGLFSIIDKVDIPVDKKNELSILVNNKINNITPSVKDYYDGKITKEQLLGKITRTTDLIEEELKKNGITGIKVSAEANVMVDTLEKIKDRGIKEIDGRKKDYLSQAKQFSALLLSNNDDLLVNLTGGMIEEIAGNEKYEDIIEGLKNQTKKIEGIIVDEINEDNIDLVKNTVKGINGEEIVKKIKEINKEIDKKDITKEKKEKLMSEKIKLVDKYNVFKKEIEEMEKGTEEWEKIELELQKLELQEKNIKDKAKREMLKMKINEKKSKIDNLKKDINKGLEMINRSIIEGKGFNKDVVLKMKQGINEMKLKEISKDIIPVLDQFKDSKIIDNEEFNKKIETMLGHIINGDESQFMNQLLYIRKEMIEQDKIEEFDKVILEKAGINLHNKALSHLMNSQYFEQILKFNNGVVGKLLDQIESGNKQVIKIIDTGGIKYFTKNENNLKQLINLLEKDKEKKDVLLEIKEELKLNDKQFEKNIKDILLNEKADEEQKGIIKGKLLKMIYQKIENTEDENKKRKLKNTLDKAKDVLDIDINKILKNVNNLKVLDETVNKAKNIDYDNINKKINGLYEIEKLMTKYTYDLSGKIDLNTKEIQIGEKLAKTVKTGHERFINKEMDVKEIQKFHEKQKKEIQKQINLNNTKVSDNLKNNNQSL